MLSNRNGARSFLLIALVSCLLLDTSCSGHQSRKTTVRRTIAALRNIAESEAGVNFRHAIEVLERDGLAAPPVMLSAAMGDLAIEGHGWLYGFMWVDISGEVRGFYFRLEGKPDIDVFPTIYNEPQVEGTAWIWQAGPVVTSPEELAKLEGEAKARAIVLERWFLESRHAQVGLILADGRKSERIPVLFRRKGPEGWFDLTPSTETRGTLGSGEAGLQGPTGKEFK